ncbi:sodium:solute symporter [Tundrisphaera lichenicola]|uniref:sodium:solute symporter n=1 Tax=Tundrisphaera lichenicola TaxID=2029860 RepID=UPI003EBCDFD4
MQPLDFGVLLLYIVGCTALGARIGSGSGTKGLKGYFLGESNIPGWAVMISIVATETSAVTFLSVPGIAVKGDMTFLQLALGYIAARVVVTLVLLPSYFKGEIYTAYQVLEVRFGGATQKAASILFLVTRTLASGLRLFLASMVLREITGWELSWSIVVIGILTLIYTYLGGIKAVVWIDVIQFAVYLVAAGVAMVILVRQIPGGWDEIWQRGMAANKFRVINFGFDGVARPQSLGEAGSALYGMLTQTYTFWAGLIGGLVLDTATHGADQMMVQRYLTARSQKSAGWALIASGFVILAQFALFLTIGVGLWVLYQDQTPDRVLEKTDQYFPYFIVHYLPTGLLGLVIAAVFSVTMSTVSGALSSSASSAVNDLYRPLFPRSDEKHLLLVSKGMTAFWGVAQLGVALAAERLSNSVVDNALAVASFVTGLLLGLFLLGLWTKDVGQNAAFVGLIAGTAAVSAVKFLTDVSYPWYALVGSGTLVIVGILASRLLPEGARADAGSLPPSPPGRGPG